MRKTVLSLFGALAVCTAWTPDEVAAAELYKWRDAAGNVHYGDRPPGGVETQALSIRVRSYEGPPRVFSLSDVPLTFGSDATVTLYSAQWCGVCERAKRYMDAHGITYKEYDIDKDPTGRRHFRMLGAKGVPVLVVGERRMDGFTPRRLEALLDAAANGR